jgi:CofD-related protein of GAK system
LKAGVHTSQGALIRRRVLIPDELRLERYVRAPELGPRLLFLSGGSALKGVSRVLKRYTHNSVHLITAFDSGGSSAVLRRAFGILSVGDLRNRLMALADETARGNPSIYALFSHRLASDAPQLDLRRHVAAMARGDDALIDAIDAPLRRVICTRLQAFEARAQRDFDMRGASIGNLILAGGMLEHEHDIDSVVFLFSRLVQVLGTVRPIVTGDFHLAATRHGVLQVGQHVITADRTGSAPIENMRLVQSLETPEPIEALIGDDRRELIERADLIVFPTGSFFTSVIANLLPRGVGATIARTGCPKIYVPNAGLDPEQAPMDVAGCVSTLLSTLRRDAPDAATSDLLDVVLVDTHAHYAGGLDLDRLRKLGVSVVDAPLARVDDPTRFDHTRLVQTLLSFS